jgi:DNA modification methylase
VSGNPSDFLERVATELRREIGVINRMDSALVERDIAARRREADPGKRWALLRTRIQKELEKLGISEADWCKSQLGCVIQTMQRRRQIARDWLLYERRRREAGDTGMTGLLYGLSLITSQHRSVTNSRISHRETRVRSGTDVARLDASKCQFITSDALTELRKMRAMSVNVVICSPPYWPLKRSYGGRGIGYEPTAEKYIANLVAIFLEASRVLRNNGLIWIVVGDSYSNPTGGRTSADTYLVKRLSSQKERMPEGAIIQPADLPAGNLLLMPERLAMALQRRVGLILRHKVIWDKVYPRPESEKDRVTQSYDTVLMFAKQKGYYYDQDPLRTPSLMRDAINRDSKFPSNPMGRNSTAVWQIIAGSYKGNHNATFPVELARRMVALSCDDNSLVLDPFGGAGTTAMVALQMGHRAITVDINPEYTREAQQRIANAPARMSDDDEGEFAEAAD